MTRLIMLLCIGIAFAVYPPAAARAAQDGGITISKPRASAIHECATAAARFPDYAWGNMEMFIYRACMRRHLQPE